MPVVKTLFRSFVLGVCVSAACSGAAIVWNFAGEPGNQVSTNATTLLANVTEGDIFRGSGLTPAATANAMNSSGFTMGGVIDVNDYYGFTVTADPGFALDLTSLLFSERRSGTGILTIEVRSSLDAFATAIGGPIGVPSDTLTRRQNVNLSAALFDNLTSIEFRIYGYSAGGASGTWRLGISAVSGENLGGHPNDVTLNLDVVAVPESGTFVLGGLGLLLTGVLRARYSNRLM